MVFIGLFLFLFISLWAILKVPSVQNFLVSKVTSYISDKTHTRVELAYIDLEFPKSILLQGIFLEDQKHDTLIAAKELELDINMLALLTSTVSIESTELDDFSVHLKRNERDSTFNFQFLLDAFTSDNKKEVSIDTTKSGTPWTVKAKSIVLSHGRFNMEDSLSGLYMNLSLGEMKGELNKLDLNKSFADVGDISLSDVHGSVRSTKQSTPDTSTSAGWRGVSVSGLTIERSSFSYSDQISSLFASATIGILELEHTSIDLIEQAIVSDGLSIEQSSSLVQLKKSNTTSYADTSTSGWNVQVSSLQLEQNDFKMDIVNEAEISSGIDWNHLALTNINTDAKDLVYNGPLIEATIESLSAQDKSGFGIRSLETKAYMDANKASLTDLSLVTNHSRLGQDIRIQYSSLEELISTLSVDCNMKNNQVAVKDLLLLVPALDTIEIIHKNKDRS
ncbi:MAG: translocation/assembly module TamB domain-containing protein, partial [Cytophaga sp.]